MKRTIVFFAILALSTGIAVAQDEQYEVDIQPSAASAALEAFADQTGLQVVYLAEVVEGLESRGFSGSGTAAEVLTALLAGTGLEWRFENERTVTVSRSDADDSGPAADEKGRFQGSIVVTANLREENPVDVSSSVSAYDENFIEERSFDNINQLLALTPGAYSTPGSPLGDDSFYVIRGIATGFGTATVGVYVDDTAVTTGGGGTEPTLRLFDMERVEVLRGPQGTLYGASSMGGAIKYITNKPNLGEIQSQVRFEGASVNGGEHDVALDAAVSVPIVEDKLAIRFAGSYVDGGGYIDLPNAEGGPYEDSNTRQTTSLRGILRWQPTQKLTLDLTAFGDKREYNGQRTTPSDAPSYWLDPLRLTYPAKYERDFLQLALNLSYDLGWAELRSFTSSADSSSTSDFPAEASQWQPASYGDLWSEENIFQQELRLLSTAGGRWTWVAGLFYSDVYTEDDFKSSIPDWDWIDYFHSYSSRDRQQLSAYGEATYQISERWLATAGLRHFTEDVATFISSAFMGAPSVVEGDDSFTATTPRFILSYRPSDRTNLYASASQGFRVGGVNTTADPRVPTGYDPDTLWAYEVGVKTTTGKLNLATALFYNDWEDIQNYIYDYNISRGYIINAGKAHTAGVELTIDYHIATGLMIGVNAGLTEAQFDEAMGEEGAWGSVAPGDRIPQTPEWSFALLFGYDRPLSANTVLSIRVDGAYEGDRVLPDQTVGSERIERWNALIGVVWSSYEIAAFVRNITNEVAVPPEVNQYGTDIHINQPRAIGLQLVARF